jgi:hypothetical protein
MKKHLSLIAIILTAIVQIDCTPLKTTRLFTRDDCEILADKRTARKSLRQPKVRHLHMPKSAINRDAESAPTLSPFVNPGPPVFYADVRNEAFPRIDFVQEDTWIVPADKKAGQNIDAVPALHCIESVPDSQPLVQTKPEHSFIADNSALNFFAISGAISMAIISVFRRSFMQFSSWASKNPRTTRAMIASVQTGTVAASYWAGYTLAEEGVQFTSLAAATAAGATVVAGIGSVVKGLNLMTFTQDYLRHKLLHAALFASSAAMVCYVGNTHYTPRNNTMSLAGYSIPLSSVSSSSYHEAPSKSALPDPPKKKKTGWRILTITLFVVATFFVAAGVCALTCEGYTFGAILLGVGLETSLVLLMNYILRKLSGETKEERAIRKARRRGNVPAEIEN